MVDSGKQKIQQRLESLTRALQSGTAGQVRILLSSLHPSETADLLDSLPHGPREILWELVDKKDKGEILTELNDEVRSGLINEMEPGQLIAVTEGLDTDDLADLLQDLPGAVTQEVLHSMDMQNRHSLEAVLSYPEDTAGGLMNLDMVTVRANVNVDVVLRYLRLRGDIPDLTDSLVVVDRFNHYQGMLPLTTLLTSDPDSNVYEVMSRDINAISANMADVDVARLFQDRDLVSAPVVDSQNKLLGRITIDDVVDVIRDEADRSLMNMAGLDEEEDIFAPVILSARRRAVWLGLNLATAFLASWVIGLFESTLQQVVALAVLMPIVASMGGIAGSQTLTIMIRGLALGQVGSGNSRSLMQKELLVATMNSLVWSAVVALIAMAWFQNMQIGLIIAGALIINLLFAALAGWAIPLGLKRVGIDPALAGTVLLTTVTDVVGFVAFLGLGTFFLL